MIEITMFGKKKTAEKKSTDKKHSRSASRINERFTTSISATPKTSGDTEEFLYISNESHYEQVIERIKNVRKTLWIRLSASANVKNFLLCKRTKSVLALPILKIYM